MIRFFNIREPPSSVIPRHFLFFFPTSYRIPFISKPLGLPASPETCLYSGSPSRSLHNHWEGDQLAVNRRHTLWLRIQHSVVSPMPRNSFNSDRNHASLAELNTSSHGHQAQPVLSIPVNLILNSTYFAGWNTWTQNCRITSFQNKNKNRNVGSACARKFDPGWRGSLQPISSFGAAFLPR